MNKRMMNVLLLAGLLIPQYQQAENVSCKQKMKNAVSILCKKIPSKKTCLIALSAVVSTALTIGALLKYTDVLSKIFSKNGTEKLVENNTGDSKDIPNNQPNNQDKKQNQNQHDSQKNNADEVKALPVEEKKSDDKDKLSDQIKDAEYADMINRIGCH